jgi:Ca2+/Na+ antiporter
VTIALVIAALVLGLVVLMVAADVFVVAAQTIALRLGWSNAFKALAVVAVAALLVGLYLLSVPLLLALG